jgi:hypothetical protein
MGTIEAAQEFAASAKFAIGQTSAKPQSLTALTFNFINEGLFRSV